jgi:hypothetical protein
MRVEMTLRPEVRSRSETKSKDELFIDSRPWTWGPSRVIDWLAKGREVEWGCSARSGFAFRDSSLLVAIVAIARGLSRVPIKQGIIQTTLVRNEPRIRFHSCLEIFDNISGKMHSSSAWSHSGSMELAICECPWLQYLGMVHETVWDKTKEIGPKSIQHFNCCSDNTEAGTDLAHRAVRGWTFLSRSLLLDWTKGIHLGQWTRRKIIV